MNMNMLLPLILGMNGNKNMSEALVKMLAERSSGTENNNIDPMTILALSLIGNMNKNNENNKKSESVKDQENGENNQKDPNLSDIEKFSSVDISEALRMMINNQKM